MLNATEFFLWFLFLELNAGQTVFSIIVNLGLLLGAFFYVAKIIDKKLDIE